ncbi:MAG: gamma-glutamylcyclotransferase [Alphaproteobacteria bacterium]
MRREMVTEGHWVFGYGSLMWRPGFTFVERREAVLHGWHRAFCVYSHVHRGTPDQPGLVLGLDRGGACRGVAYRIAPAEWPRVRDYLQEREQATLVYLEARKRLRLRGGGDHGRHITALTYLADRTHVQYAGRLAEEDQVRLILQGHGRSGDNVSYLLNTVTHLDEAGLREGALHRLRDRVLAALDGSCGRASAPLQYPRLPHAGNGSPKPGLG